MQVGRRRRGEALPQSMLSKEEFEDGGSLLSQPNIDRIVNDKEEEKNIYCKEGEKKERKKERKKETYAGEEGKRGLGGFWTRRTRKLVSGNTTRSRSSLLKSERNGFLDSNASFHTSSISIVIATTR